LVSAVVWILHFLRDPDGHPSRKLVGGAETCCPAQKGLGHHVDGLSQWGIYRAAGARQLHEIAQIRLNISVQYYQIISFRCPCSALPFGGTLCAVNHGPVSVLRANRKDFYVADRTSAKAVTTNLASWTLSANLAASDEVLIARIAKGDKLAMRVLYGRHHVRVYRFGLRLVRDEQVAEDLINEVFLDVWRQAGRFEGRSAVSTWLLAITRFKALSVLRKRKDAELDEDAVAAVEDPSDDPEVSAQKKDTGKVLRQCLAALTPDHREIIDLVYYHEKSVEEVAEIVGIPENTVKTRMFYARKKLAELLKAAGVERGWP
jgi:RNA polymerase sigma-70 factor (ECF subfamily)